MCVHVHMDDVGWVVDLLGTGTTVLLIHEFERLGVGRHRIDFGVSKTLTGAACTVFKCPKAVGLDLIGHPTLSHLIGTILHLNICCVFGLGSILPVG